ncbi:serine/threonine protein kinase [Cognatitamlana onchidii]|uniref:serine/threonine protein kinase n=1 Tax=Cognatitamlana onchidii TaxID=2562860 RepID=UPI0010A5C808|nr:serine/threonine-protein kinase [Algibacter onchidii]
MHNNLHERATEIIGRVLDMEHEQAEKYIAKACAGDSDLEKIVLELYSNIKEDDKREKPKDETRQESRGFSKSRIGPGQKSKTRILGNVTQVLFGNKRGRLLSLILFLAVVFTFGFVIRQEYRKRIIELKRQEQIAMLNIHYKSLEQWISLKRELLSDLAENPDIVYAIKHLDSLVLKDPSYVAIKQDPNGDSIYNLVNSVRKAHNVESLTFVNKRDPQFMLVSGEGLSGMNKMASDIRLGPKGYQYYLKVQKEQDFVFIPPMYDSDRFEVIPPGIQAATLCTFVQPVRSKQGGLLGFIAIDSDVENEFSELLNLSYHNETAETYAVNLDGSMASKSRFEKELQQTFLLSNDTTKTSVHHIMMYDPGVNVYEADGHVQEQVEMDYTVIFAELLKNVTSETGVFEGAVLTPYKDYRGIDVVGSWKYLPEYGFGLISEIDVSEAFVALDYFDGAFYLFLLLLIGLTVLLYNSNVRLAKFGKKMKDFQQLGQYYLKQKLGEGGFGEVYQAEHTFLKTPVAIKLLKKEFIGTDMLDRFQKEVKVTASLSNPNTVRVFDYGTSESGQFYYVMEYLNGITLDKIVDQSAAIPVARVIHILLQTCYSLAEAHTKGLVHRDVKPMNIMVCNQGGLYDTIKLLDFGLVKNVDTSITQQTQINRIGGTPMFMAPERLRDPFNADHRVDVYAIGTVGLYMLSGQYLLELVSQKMLSGQETLQGGFKQQLIERTDVPDNLKALLEQCISFSVDKRPESVEVIIDALEVLKKEYPWTRQDAKHWWKTYDVYN